MHHREMGRIDFHRSVDDPSKLGKRPHPYFIAEDIKIVKTWLDLLKSIRFNEIQQIGDSPKHNLFWDCEGNVLEIEEF